MDEEDAKGERIAAQRERRQRKHKKANKDAPPEVPKVSRAKKLALKKLEKKNKAAEVCVCVLTKLYNFILHNSSSKLHIL